MLQFMTAGESHGAYMSAILQGVPSGLAIDHAFIKGELARRQQGYGRGGRQKIEQDEVALTAGLYQGKTIGAPIAFLLANKDVKIDKLPQLFRPRPGHADLAGCLKYDQGIREILERASARETVMRVSVGALAKLFLKEFGIEIISHVVQIGSVRLEEKELSFHDIVKGVKGSEVNCICEKTSRKMMAEIDQALKDRNTRGGVFEVRAKGIPVGLGSHVHYERKLDARIAMGLISLQSVKAVEFGLGHRLAATPGLKAHDEIAHQKNKGYYHLTNRAGGIEGGMSNGEEIVVSATMKPISTLRQPLKSVNMKTKEVERADFERSDICAVPAGGVIGEAIVAFELADAFLEKFGGDSLNETKRHYDQYLKYLSKR
ncbi:MAG: chorismate synthase [Candidatus Omnitrophica bacterium CG11_big_fil_rev_8_21_14_0_20_45_26]|uniref:Chorismate synthase n=1 Tax=Candidatus Abzuiibacterium crystallinum TaxID=1974748 RepID=A0A2H0LMP3_9BACT|nr:MAG: chorismate synthase [Candidatus Omnitrophica bacterium CG11_big_fil_rev_8_21_14_0_20_45_26]PIW65240.1 MAG: chorismate synthase [Candidatus Omnitrophica bacterium CG12_big_fil_rev_8_21_14_0_65_45_16]